MASPNPGLLAAMLKAQRLNGVVRWKVNFTESGFLGEVNLAGWRGTWIETSEVKSLQDFVDVAANQSANPNLIGATLAELIDTVFSDQDSSVGTCIAWTGWQDLLKSSPQVALEIAESFDSACQERQAVVMVCGSVGTFPAISELSQG